MIITQDTITKMQNLSPENLKIVLDVIDNLSIKSIETCESVQENKRKDFIIKRQN